MNNISIFVTLLLINITLIENASSMNIKVVGGIEAQPNEFPYQVALRWRVKKILSTRAPQLFCGGSVLNKNWILTAGHCNIKLSVSGKMEAMAGEYDLKNDANQDSKKQIRLISKFVVHEKYPGGTSVSPYDIGLAKIDKPFEFNEAIQPISLPTKDSIVDGDAVLSGWGSTSTSYIPKLPSKLRKAVLPIIEYSNCKQLWGYNSPVSESNVCAGDLAGKRSACSGDSGGPLVQIENGKFTQVGIVSFGMIPCGQPNKPAVFTRVSYYNDWIENKLQTE